MMVEGRKTTRREKAPLHTQDESHHGAEVAGPTTEVEEGKAGLQIQSLHHLRVDARSRQVDVSMPPRQVLHSATVGLVYVLTSAGRSVPRFIWGLTL